MNQQPDSQEFARQVLYQLSCLSAEVWQNKQLLCQILSHLTHRPAAEFQNQQTEDQLAEMAGRIYQACLERANIPPGPDDPGHEPPPPNPRVNPRG